MLNTNQKNNIPQPSMLTFEDFEDNEEYDKILTADELRRKAADFILKEQGQKQKKKEIRSKKKWSWVYVFIWPILKLQLMNYGVRITVSFYFISETILINTLCEWSNNKIQIESQVKCASIFWTCRQPSEPRAAKSGSSVRTVTTSWATTSWRSIMSWYSRARNARKFSGRTWSRLRVKIDLTFRGWRVLSLLR